MSKAALAIVVVSSLSVAAGSAWAQGNPSANSIIQSLTPHAGMSGGTRGIRPLAPQAPAPSPAHPAAATAGIRPQAHRPPAAAQTETETAPASVNLTVQFATGSARLTPQAERTLNELGRALSSQQLGTYKFRVEGHTDTVGTPELNQTLSDERARSVVEYLVSHFGIDRSRLEPVGMGETHLLVPTSQNVAEPRNRRVTVINLGA